MATQAEDSEFLTPNQLGRLLPLVPTILALLRETNPMAADLFLEGEEVDRKATNYLMSELLNSHNFDHDPSMMEMRFSFASYKTPVWLGVLREVLTGCYPRLVPDKVAGELLGSLGNLTHAQSSVECAYVLGPLLDKIPRTRVRVLAEFCAFLRDTSSAPEDMACLTGPFLLCPSTTLTHHGTSLIASQTAASAAVMDMLILECELLFGRTASSAARNSPLGVRQASAKPANQRRSFAGSLMKRISFKKAGPPPGLGPVPSTNKGGRRAPPPPPPRVKGGGSSASSVVSGSSGSSVTSSNPSLKEKRMLGLRVFYQWRDPRRANGVASLFENYKFEEIALAIQRKYYMLPPGWKEQLDYLQMTGNPNLGWFARLKQGILPAPVEPEERSRNAQAPQEETKIDKIINEIADTEQRFNKTLVDLMNLYVNVIKSIADGNQGQAAVKALGLTTQQLDHIFGNRLLKIVEFSNNLLSALEIVSLVRVQPKAGRSRIQLVTEVFEDCSQQLLHLFGPFACAHKTSVTYLRQARQMLEEQNQGGALRRLGSFLGGDSPKSFLEIWEEASDKSDNLRGQTLESVLIMPIQRVPRYKLLLDELRKATPESDSCYRQLESLVEVVKGLNTDINEAIRAHERLMKRFGDDFAAPQASRGTKGGVKNVYG